jgi:alpha-D-ribose 1-methylphosphonate 5-triphosphate diphosphatase
MVEGKYPVEKKRYEDILITDVCAVTSSRSLPCTDIFVRDGIIDYVGKGKNSWGVRSIDGAGLTAFPGFIDLHSDAVEKWIQPRPGGRFEVELALVEMDKYLAACGITTIYHCLCFGDNNRRNELRRAGVTSALTRTINRISPQMNVRHRIHARFEILDKEFVDILRPLIEEKQIHLFSLMDHTPGQGQFTSIEHFTSYYSIAVHMSPVETAQLAERRIRRKRDFDDAHVRELASLCHAHGIPMASHDDDTPEKVRWVKGMGIGISEFPVRQIAAKEAKSLSMDVLMGAPNVLRGGSLTENLSGREAIEAGFCNIMGSDYAPMSMLHAVFALHNEMDLPLHEAVNMITHNPARAIGKKNCMGSIQAGQAADLLLVDVSAQVPRIIKTFVKGREVFSTCPP